jgi:hypothetical protein
MIQPNIDQKETQTSTGFTDISNLSIETAGKVLIEKLAGTGIADDSGINYLDTRQYSIENKLFLNHCATLELPDTRVYYDKTGNISEITPGPGLAKFRLSNQVLFTGKAVHLSIDENKNCDILFEKGKAIITNSYPLIKAHITYSGALRELQPFKLGTTPKNIDIRADDGIPLFIYLDEYSKTTYNLRIINGLLMPQDPNHKYNITKANDMIWIATYCRVHISAQFLQAVEEPNEKIKKNHLKLCRRLVYKPHDETGIQYKMTGPLYKPKTFGFKPESLIYNDTEVPYTDHNTLWIYENDEFFIESFHNTIINPVTNMTPYQTLPVLPISALRFGNNPIGYSIKEDKTNKQITFEISAEWLKNNKLSSYQRTCLKDLIELISIPSNLTLAINL